MQRKIYLLREDSGCCVEKGLGRAKGEGIVGQESVKNHPGQRFDLAGR